MTINAIIFLIICWSLIISVCGLSFRKLLKNS